MKDFKIIAGTAIAATIIWHLIVAFSPDIKITGLFKAKPCYGYSWEEMENKVGGLGITFDIDNEKKRPLVKTVLPGSSAYLIGLKPNHYITKINGIPTDGMTKERIRNLILGRAGTKCKVSYKYDSGLGFNFEYTMSFIRTSNPSLDDQVRLENAYKPKARYFWENKSVKWCPGFVHPEYNVYASQTKDSWDALAGYVFTGNKKKSLDTEWKAGLPHPFMKAYSASIERKWAPGLGYEFVMEDGLAVNTVWKSYKTYDDLKIYTSGTEGTFHSYPGYSFTHPNKNLDVAWTPGSRDPIGHPNQVAGRREGQWVSLSEYNDNGWENHIGTSIIAAMAGEFIRWLLGRNFITSQLMRIAGEELFNGAWKAIQ